jgi:hypothetical protein
MSRSFDYEADATKSAAANILPNDGGHILGEITEADGSTTPCVLLTHSKAFEGDLQTIKTADDEELVGVGGKLRRKAEWLAEQDAPHNPPEDD